METIIIENDIRVMYVTAEDFPKGIPETYKKLHDLIPNVDDRKYFGISYPNESGKIIYKAAAEELEEDEADKYGLESFTIKAAKYLCIEIKNFKEDEMCIGTAFQKLIHQPGIDPQGYCLEWYLNYTDPDVKCMVGLK